MKVREQVLHAISLVHDFFGNTIATVPSLVTKLSPLLNDSQANIRNLAVETFGKLHHTFGPSLIVSTI